ncbi:MAG TPA: thrombospondin type 3 repeat-containing protein [Patescibacteria group bacterium]|nr:thrombospondin type 3 repeat-containing protein [Patescibacteria group bacterium]
MTWWGSRDNDGDGISNREDNCWKVYNPDQTNTNSCPNERTGEVSPLGQYYLAIWTECDDDGDACDDDDDGDGIPDKEDNCRLIPNPNQVDKEPEPDGIGDACQGDLDGDGWRDHEDNCPFVANPNQADMDNDRLGNRCDAPPPGVHTCN